MSDPAIQIENLSKRYIIGHQSEADTLRDRLTGLFSQKFRAKKTEEFWALQDISFSVQPGEVVGIVGRNGAGKSTLLKVLSRITEPTTGRITLNGRIASLLEVGTGFHPELTGRENIFLNGAILGMSRGEIRRRFAEIVAFAEIDQFLDTPVKHYSSGMYVRLAFSVAAHLDPEILIIDEVLAVGDVQFQRKCLGKMRDVAANQSRAVIFVSHQISTVTSLCTRAIWMEHGRIAGDGEVQETTAQFLRSLSANAQGDGSSFERAQRSGSGQAKITSAEIYSRSGTKSLSMPRMGDTFGVRFRVENLSAMPGSEFRLSVAIKTITGQRLVHVCNEDDSFSLGDNRSQWVEVELPSLQIYPGTYTLTLWIGTPRYSSYDYLEDCLTFEVAPAAHLPRAFKTDWSQGLFLHESKWRTPDQVER